VSLVHVGPVGSATRALAVFAGAAALASLVAAGRRGRLLPVARYTVNGPSMEPSLREGDRVLVWRWAYRRRLPAAGDVVVVRDPDDRRRVLIKRVAPDGDESRVHVLGDNAAASRDSRTFGAVPAASILGKALLKY